MKLSRLLAVLVVLALMMLAGCGSGGGNYNGGLTVTVSKSDNGNSTSDVSFTVTYVNSQVTDYQGLDFSVVTTLDGAVIDSGTDHFASSGIKTITYTAIPAGSTIRLQAQVGDIISAASATVTPSALTVTPTSLDLGAGATPGLRTGVAAVSGGTKPYSVNSSTADVTGAFEADGFTLDVTIVNQNTTGTAKTATLTIHDDAGKTATFTVTY